MIMSNNEKDEFIKQKFAEDKLMVSREQVGVQIKNDIDVSKNRIRKHTDLERYLMVLLVVLLLISVFCNIYLIKNRNANPELKNNGLADEYTPKNLIFDVDPIINKIEENRAMQNTTVVDLDTDEDDELPADDEKEEEESTPPKTVEDTPSSHEIDEEVIEKELTQYAITIGRYGDDASDLEKNTMLLLIANDFFNNSVSKSTGLELSSNGKYAMTGKNVHKFVEELTGTKVNGYLQSFTNYMKYNVNSKFYSAGVDSTKLNEEKYEITSMKVTEGSTAGEYKVIGNINKKSQIEIVEKANTRVEDIEANYSFEATLVENSNYTYVQYQIKDFVTELRPGDEDNIIRLVGITEQAEENAKKK